MGLAHADVFQCGLCRFPLCLEQHSLCRWSEPECLPGRFPTILSCHTGVTSPPMNTSELLFAKVTGDAHVVKYRVQVSLLILLDAAAALAHLVTVSSLILFLSVILSFFLSFFLSLIFIYVWESEYVSE